MLKYNHVSVSCQRVPILADISLSFPKGKITSLIGPNGCGKTTLLQCLNGVSHVTSGNICLNGQDYLKLPPRERARKLSFLPQIRTTIPTLPVRTLVEHGRFPYLGFSRKKSAEDISIVQRAMDFTHISQYADQYVDTLSGGIRQRVFFAMTLAQDCDTIVLDEPVTYLDLQGQKDFFDMLLLLRRQEKTIILTLHDLSHAIRISDQLIVMEKMRKDDLEMPYGRKKAKSHISGNPAGKVAACGAPRECLPAIEKIFNTKYKKFEDREGTYYFFG